MRLSTAKKVWGLPQRDRALLVEAIFWLAIASLAIAFLPFRSVAAAASRRAQASSPPDQGKSAIVSRVQWAVIAAARRMPWRAVCFQQGLAAHLMLRRRGVPSIIYYGAAQIPDDGLTAHVWVRAGALDVVGCETASQYALLATFPPTSDGLSRATSD
jgi:hypothetical protein